MKLRLLPVLLTLGVVASVVSCFALVVCVLIGDAYAQMGGMGGMGGMGRGSREGGSSRERERASAPVPQPEPDSFEQIDYRLSLLEEALKLQNTQWNAWNAFANKTRAYAQDVLRERGREALGTSASQMRGLPHIGQAVDVARNRLAALEDVEVAAKALYGQLSPDQQAMADARIPTIVAPRRGQAAQAGRGGPAGAAEQGGPAAGAGRPETGGSMSR